MLMSNNSVDPNSLEGRMLAALEVLINAPQRIERILAIKFAEKYKDPGKGISYADAFKEAIKYYKLFAEDEELKIIKKMPQYRTGSSGHIDIVYQLLDKPKIAREKIKQYVKAHAILFETIKD